MLGVRKVGRWSRVASNIAYAQAGLAFCFFVFLGAYATAVYHRPGNWQMATLLSASLLVLGVPSAFVGAALAFRSSSWSAVCAGAAAEAAWVGFAVWAMIGQALDHDVDFLNNLPVYVLLAGAGLVAACMPFFETQPLRRS